ncbi:MAG: heme ABC exporter ATP-binding protein CcmA [Pseudomonadota bacterium]
MIERVQADHITISRGGRTVVRDLSFSVHAGSALIVRGPNGAGKTTLLRALAGLIAIDGGAFRLTHESEPAGTTADESVRADVPITDHIVYVGHTNGLKSGLTVQENLSFWTAYAGVPRGAISDALARFGLVALADIPVEHLSAGQRRRAGLARLITAPQPIWVLDEPTTSLDQASAQRVGEAINEHLGRGGIAIAATHLALDITHADTLDLRSRAIAENALDLSPASTVTFERARDDDEIWL